MPLFKIDKRQVSRIIPSQLQLERDLHVLFEDNLERMLNIYFLAHEYSTSSGGRIDTLGIDQYGSPCIIEYKRNQNSNVINQGLFYLKWLLDHKAEFEKLYSDACKGDENLPERKIDWDSPRVICIAESYNKFDIATADLLDIKIELLKYTFYEGGIIHIEGEQYNENTTHDPRKKTTRSTIKQLQQIFTLEHHTKKASKPTLEAFDIIREYIVSLDKDIIEQPRAQYIAYKLATNFVDVVILKSSLIIYLNVKSNELVDPRGVARDLINPRKIGHWGNGDYDIRVTKATDISYLLSLIKQSYDLNK